VARTTVKQSSMCMQPDRNVGPITVTEFGRLLGQIAPMCADAG
jgi:hypothetical protein